MKRLTLECADREEEIARILKQVEVEVRKGLKDDPGTLDDIEEEAQRIGEKVKSIVERQRLNSKGNGYVGARIRCECGQFARHRSKHVRQVTTQSGVRRIMRSYYYCDACHAGFHPLDQVLQLAPGEFSVRVLGLVARFAGYLPFEAACREMHEILNVNVSASSIRRKAIACGGQLVADLGSIQAQLQSQAEDFSSDRYPNQLHTSMDGCMVMVNKQWREVKTAVVYQRRAGSEHEIACADYVSSLAESKEFGPKMRTLAFLNGADHCCHVGMVADGAKWIWQETAKYLPRAKQIVDFYHAMDYIWAIANAQWGEKSQEAVAWANQQQQLLLEDQVEAVIASMKSWQPHSNEDIEIQRTTIGYFEEHKERMRYKSCRSQGWHIGSGVMEAANKAVVEQRMKRSGMRWQNQGAEAILHLRAAIMSTRKVDYRDLAARATRLAPS